jgi:hypothetical protein
MGRKRRERKIGGEGLISLQGEEDGRREGV